MTTGHERGPLEDDVPGYLKNHIANKEERQPGKILIRS